MAPATTFATATRASSLSLTTSLCPTPAVATTKFWFLAIREVARLVAELAAAAACNTALCKESVAEVQQQQAKRSLFVSLCGLQTMFANELLRHYAGRTIVYENQEQKHRWLLLPNGTVFRGGLDAFADELGCGTTVYICDCGKEVYRNPEVCNARTIVLSSPNKKHYEGWLSEHRSIRRLYLPLWSLEEVRAVVPAIYPLRMTAERDAEGDTVLDAAGNPVQVEQHVQRFRIYGGSARFIFSPEEDDLAMDSLTARIRACDLLAVIQTASTELKTVLPVEDITWRFVRINVEESDAAGHPSYQRVHLDFISDHILGRLVARKQKEHRSQLLELLREGGASVSSDTSTLRGKVFERYALNELAKGGVFRARWLGRADIPEMLLSFAATRQVGIKDALNNLQPGVRGRCSYQGGV